MKNHHKQNQNLLCYHYTIGQTYRCVRYEPLFSDPPSHNSTAKVMLFLGLPKFFAVFSFEGLLGGEGLLGLSKPS